MNADHSAVTGKVSWELRAADGALVRSGVTHNILTAYGERVMAERYAGITGADAAATGMKLGTGTTAPAKTGAGSALVTYLTNSHNNFDSTYPKSAAATDGRQITYKATYGAGSATSTSAITEVVLVNQATLTNATSASGETLARALLSGVGSKGAGETLTVTWVQLIKGA
jgi:hypothetical protein